MCISRWFFHKINFKWDEWKKCPYFDFVLTTASESCDSKISWIMRVQSVQYYIYVKLWTRSNTKNMYPVDLHK